MTRQAGLAGPALAVGLAAGLLAAPLPAQSWRTLEVSRQLHDSAALSVSVHYAAGRLAVHATSAPLLYDMRLRYDAQRTEPVHAYSASRRTLSVGVRRQDVRLPDDEDPAELRLDLAERVPLDLSLELGATEADLDLSGLRVHDLSVTSGASEATLRFDTPNPERMRSLRLKVGAASLTATGLANANAPNIVVSAGVGGVELDLGGAWTQDIALALRVALGGVRIRVPSDVGVRVEARMALASFEHDGLVRRGGAYVSENWDSAPHKLVITSKATLGKLELDRR